MENKKTETKRQTADIEVSNKTKGCIIALKKFSDAYWECHNNICDENILPAMEERIDNHYRAIYEEFERGIAEMIMDNLSSSDYKEL